MKLMIEIAAAALLVVCISATSAAFAAGKAGQERRRPRLLLQRREKCLARGPLRRDPQAVRRKILRQLLRRQDAVGDVSSWRWSKARSCAVPTKISTRARRWARLRFAHRDDAWSLARQSIRWSDGRRAMTLISKSKPASQFTPTAVQFGKGASPIAFSRTGASVSHWVPGIGVEGGHVHDVVERAAGGLQHGAEIVEGELDLLFELRLGRAVSRLPTWPETNRRSPERIAAE